LTSRTGKSGCIRKTSRTARSRRSAGGGSGPTGRPGEGGGSRSSGTSSRTARSRRSPRSSGRDARRPEPSAAPEVRPFRLDRVFGILSLAAFGVLAVSLFLSSPYFGVSEIMVIGSDHLSRGEIVELCGIALGTNILRIPTGDIRSRLEAHPRVASAVVSRRFPDRILVEIVEREGVVLLPSGEEYAELDSQGRAVELHRYIAGLGLPVVTGVEATGLASGDEVAADGLGAALCCSTALGIEGRLAVSEIHVDPGGELTLYTRDGVPVYFGPPTGLDAKVEVFLAVLPELEAGELEISYVDVRYPRYPVLGATGDFADPEEWPLQDPDAAVMGGP